MEKRTESEIRSIVKRCVEIEKAGGDVLAYLRSEHYISPGATWWNFQKGYLNRSAASMTSGKPKERSYKFKEEKHMDDNGKKVPKDQFQETARTAVNIAMSGISPMKYLKDKGYTQPAQAWKRIKDWCKENDPESYAKLPKNVKTLKQPKETGAMHREKLEAQKIDKAPETVVVDGKEYEKMDGIHDYPGLPGAAEKDIYGRHPVTAYVEKPSPTCCQPAKPSGVTVPDDVPEEKPEEKPAPVLPPELLEKETEFPLKVCGIAGSVGVYGISIMKKNTMRFKRIDGEKAWELEMSIEDWRRFITETLLVLKAFGV